MLFSYLVLAFRLLSRNPFVTLINVIGLSIGFATFYILWPYTESELNTDSFHKDAGQIVRFSRVYQPSAGDPKSRVELPMHNCVIAKEFASTYPEITELTRIIPQEEFLTFRQGFGKDLFIAIPKEGDRRFFREKNIAYADENFFRFFSFPLLSGSADEVLRRPKSVVVSEEVAVKYFGSENPLHKYIYLNDSLPLKITGVFKTLPRNTHFTFDMVMTTVGVPEIDNFGWELNWWAFCYARMRKGTDLSEFENNINKNKEKIYGTCPTCPKESFTTLLIQPLNELIFKPMPSNPFHVRNEYMLQVLRALSFIVIIMAWVNYIGLSIHLFYKRMPHLGARKVSGAGLRDFATQFIMEAAVVNAIALLLAITLVQLIRIPLNVLLNFYVVPLQELSPTALTIMVLTPFAGIILSGLYPLFILRKRNPTDLLKQAQTYRSPFWLQGIITAQYAAAIALVIWVTTVYLQLTRLINKDVGIHRDGIVIVNCPLEQGADFDSKLAYLKTKLLRLEGVIGVTVSKTTLGDLTSYGIPLQRNKNDLEFGIDTNGGVDEDFVPTYGIKLVAGRNFRGTGPSDNKALILSEDATRQLGFKTPESALGARLTLPWSGVEDAEVIGIYKDYEFRPHFAMVRLARRGSFLSYRNNLVYDFFPSKLSIRVDLNKVNPTMKEAEEVFTTLFPREIFTWDFLDDNINRAYVNEKVARNQITLFTIIAIAISCLGLVGLISNKIVTKTKEIGIRKVLGAELMHISYILLQTTVKQLTVAAAAGIAVAYFLSIKYLEKFSDRITLEWWQFVLPMACVIIIMFASIGVLLMKAATRNPVDSIRYD
jgi:putative ABC transport system permease protein